MSLYLGSNKLKDLYLGSTKIKDAYFGSTKVYTSIEPPPVPTWGSADINGQIWMTENLAYDDGGEGITSRDIPNVNGVSLGTQYYYTWPAAMRIASSINGWHLPTSGEYKTLLDYAGGLGGKTAGKNLRATSSWNNNNNGDDIYGFNWVAAGQLTTSWDNPGTRGCLWVSAANMTAKIQLNVFCNVDTGNGKVMTGNQGASAYLSVRLIKDSE